MKKSFLNSNTPFITAMVQVPTAKQAEIKIRNAIADGATAIGFQMSSLEKQYRTEETLSLILAATENKPVYFTNYRFGFNAGMTDDELMKGLLFGFQLCFSRCVHHISLRTKEACLLFRTGIPERRYGDP